MPNGVSHSLMLFQMLLHKVLLHAQTPFLSGLQPLAPSSTVCAIFHAIALVALIEVQFGFENCTNAGIVSAIGAYLAPMGYMFFSHHLCRRLRFGGGD